ncbi:MAG: hypothetical protein JRI41_08955 [Deltaproteobacteria bacterium]|nr:hypothetical protein [Deltaproteobacteria bacterium]
MFKLRREKLFLLLLIVFLVPGICSVLVAQEQGNEEKEVVPVKVVNKSPIAVEGEMKIAEKVEVEGAVELVNEPTVRAEQSGDWTLTLDAGSSIGVTDEDHPARQLVYYVDGEGCFPNHSPLMGFTLLSSEIPKGMVGVIEHISIHAALPRGQSLTKAYVEGAWGFFSHYLAVLPQGRDYDGNSVFAIS